jgi:hypothetical protein
MSLQTEQERLDKVTDRMTDEILKKRIFAEYKKTLNEIRKMVALFYEKYAVDGELDMVEAQKYGRLDKLEKAIQDELRTLGNKQNRAIKRLLTDVYYESYGRTAYGIRTEAIERG